MRSGAAAGVSKQTVYKQFIDKKQLLYDIVLGITGRSAEITTIIESLFEGMHDLDVELSSNWAGAMPRLS